MAPTPSPYTDAGSTDDVYSPSAFRFPSRAPTFPPASVNGADEGLPSGAILGLAIFAGFGLFLLFVYIVHGISQSESSGTTRPALVSFAPDPRPSVPPVSSAPPSRPPPATKVDLVCSMTRQQRREYVANFLRTQKYGTKTHSGRFIVSQSKRNLAHTGKAEGCAICLEEFTDGEDVCLSQNKQCTHQFHLTCAFEWLLKSQECPCCRRDYLTIEEASYRRLAAPSAPLESYNDTTSASTAPNEELTPREILSRSISVTRLDV